MRVMATGRSDYPNQINNVLAFPGIFRGALDARATAITEEMKLAAARGIACGRRRRRAGRGLHHPERLQPRRGARGRGRRRRGGGAHGEPAPRPISRPSSAPPSADARRRHRRDRHDRQRARARARGARRRGHRPLARCRAGQRGARRAAETWADPEAERPPLDALRGRDAVVHLLGERDRAALDRRGQARDPRLARAVGTRNLVAALARAARRASARACSCRGSGVGYYGHRGDERLDERPPARATTSSPSVSADWEAEARAAEELGRARGR